MYNQRQSVSRIAIGGRGIAVGQSGRMLSTELIQRGRARRLGIGNNMVAFTNNNPACGTGGIPQNCAPQVPVCPENQKRWTLPFVPDTGFTEVVAAGATVRFVAFPQGLFIGERLIVPSTIGPYFNIVDFRIANKPQTMASGEVPADMYSEVSTLDTMKYDQAYPGIQVVLTARNKSAISQTFQCSLSGWAVG